MTEVAIEITQEQKAMIRRRAVELLADPWLGLRWEEFDARIGSRGV